MKYKQKKINVIDLDKTLLKIDSLRYMLLWRLSIKMLWPIVLRLLKLTSKAQFCAAVVDRIETVYFRNDKELEAFLASIIQYIDQSVLKFVEDNTDESTMNIILSASPDYYVAKLASSLNMIGHGSKYKDGKFLHCYAENKVDFLLSQYPETEFIYNMSISDSFTDINLLKKFQYSYIYRDFKIQELQDYNVNKENY